MPIVRANELNQYYELYGKGPLVVLICGFAMNHLFWQSYIEPLAKHFKVLIYDPRGCGETESPEPPYSIEMMAEDLAGLLEVLSLPPASIVGHSMGSFIAMQIARDYPDKVNRLVLCASAAVLPAQARLQLKTSYDLLQAHVERRLIFQSALPWLYSHAFLSDPKNVDGAIQLMLQDPYPQDIVGYLGQMDALQSFDIRESLSRIVHKSMVITGQEDFLTPPYCAQELSEQLSDSHLLILPHQAHQFPLEIPEMLIHLIHKFLM